MCITYCALLSVSAALCIKRRCVLRRHALANHLRGKAGRRAVHARLAAHVQRVAAGDCQVEGAQRHCHGALTHQLPSPSLDLAVHGSSRLLSAASAFNAKLREAMTPERQGSNARRSADTLALPSG